MYKYMYYLCCTVLVLNRSGGSSISFRAGSKLSVFELTTRGGSSIGTKIPNDNLISRRKAQKIDFLQLFFALQTNDQGGREVGRLQLSEEGMVTPFDPSDHLGGGAIAPNRPSP